MFMIDDIKKQISESKDRWDKIDVLVEQIKKDGGIHADLQFANLQELLLLIVEQIKPAYSPDTLEKGMKEVMDMFIGGKKDGK